MNALAAIGIVAAFIFLSPLIGVVFGETPWMITDMAVAEESFHWEECPNSNALSQALHELPEHDLTELLADG